MPFICETTGVKPERNLLLWIFWGCLLFILVESQEKDNINHDLDYSSRERHISNERSIDFSLLNGIVQVHARYLNESHRSTSAPSIYTNRKAKKTDSTPRNKSKPKGIFGSLPRVFEIKIEHRPENSRERARAKNVDIQLLDRAANEYARYLSYVDDAKRIPAGVFRKTKEQAREFVDTLWRTMKNVSSAVDMTKCYETYGCFSISYPWSSLRRPVTLFPESPSKVDPQYCLYTRRNPTECHKLRLGDPTSIFRSPLVAKHKTYFISHGYLETAGKPWVQKMVAELLKKADVNVVTVDWIGGSGPTYTQAVSNIRLVGVMTAHLIKLLMEEAGVNPAKIHLIGHSLGSHLSGYVGLKMKEFGARIGRITGMDPADPQFDGMDPMVRLDPSDAIFVDIVHTDTRPFVSGGFGLAAPIGHFDVYPNGGEYQPGCNHGVIRYISEEKGSLIGGIRRYVGCNHIRSYEYFTESINSECPFAAVECPSYENFLDGKCFSCLSHGIHPEMSTSFARLTDEGNPNKTFCTQMGFHAVDPYLVGDIPTTPPKELAKFYLITAGNNPYCRHHFRVTLKISGSAKSRAHSGEFGTFWLTVRGERASYSGRLKVNPRDMYFKPGTTHSWVVSGKPVGRFTSLKVEWVFGSSLINPLLWRIWTIPSIHLSWMKVEVLESGERMTMCTEDEPLKTKTPRHFSVDDNGPCPPAKGGSVSWGFMGVRQEEDSEEEDEVEVDGGDKDVVAVEEAAGPRGGGGGWAEAEDAETKKAKEEEEKKKKTKGFGFFSFG